LTHLATK